MKKKVKLITTIASLGLALALMAFGVYAATSATFKVDGTFTFVATPNVDATIRVYESANNLAASLAADANSGWTAVEYSTGVTDYVIKYNQTTTTNGGQEGGGTFNLTNTALTESNGVGQYYCVKVEIVNNSTAASNLLTTTYTAPSATNVTVTDSGSGSVTCAQGATATIVFTFQVTDVANGATLDFNETLFTITASIPSGN